MFNKLIIISIQSDFKIGHKKERLNQAYGKNKSRIGTESLNSRI